MSLAHTILYPERCNARSEPPQPLNSEIALGLAMGVRVALILRIMVSVSKNHFPVRTADAN
jgi:hypothetical protein